MAQTRGYYTGGTIHIVVNNQIGFTTSDPRDARGTTFCTDIAKMVDAPVLHVNGDDPEVALLAVEIALEYRQRFHRDVFIDLVCFRRLGPQRGGRADGHAAAHVQAHRAARRHAQALRGPADRGGRGVARRTPTRWSARIAPRWTAASTRTRRSCRTTSRRSRSTGRRTSARHWTDTRRHHGADGDAARSSRVRLTTCPARASSCIRASRRCIADRRAMGEGTLPLDWGMGETLAYATLLDDGYGVRLSGEDIGRGTFSHRHAVLHDQNRERWDEGTYVPLQHLEARAADVRDHRLGADRAGGGRLRVRLLDVGSDAPRRLGGAVRRLRQRRAGRHRPVHQRRRSEVGPHLRPRDAAAARLRRPGSRAFVGASRALPAAVRAAQHAGVRAVDARAGLPHAAPADAAQLPQAADRDEPEEPAAAQGGGVVARRSREGRLLPRDRRDGKARRRRA